VNPLIQRAKYRLRVHQVIQGQPQQEAVVRRHPARQRLAQLRRLGPRTGPRQVHPLPRYAPECNPIERVWWRLHQAITRNHTCQDLSELVDLALAWLTDKRTFRVQDSVYATQEQTEAA